jgi:hypothetical protein
MPSLPDRDSQAAVAWFSEFAERARWRFAKTYVESYPHEYTLERGNDADLFRTAIMCIEEWGVTEAFYSSRRKYLQVGERQYWHMGDVSSSVQEEQPTLINRTWVDVSRYRSEARALGHDSEALESLVARWKMLLARARAKPGEIA